ncbi:DUF4403 family protein [Algicola sagamiensis]|uniref:DUF4403 family protein n=1 Tax=Algicola sagamiensis TaxID=163869 RepID=UPI00037A6CFB|nr:DUF4403 family protein [Algicola sagamiensis]
MRRITSLFYVICVALLASGCTLTGGATKTTAVATDNKLKEKQKVAYKTSILTVAVPLPLEKVTELFHRAMTEKSKDHYLFNSKAYETGEFDEFTRRLKLNGETTVVAQNNQIEATLPVSFSMNAKWQSCQQHLTRISCFDKENNFQDNFNFIVIIRPLFNADFGLQGGLGLSYKLSRDNHFKFGPSKLDLKKEVHKILRVRLGNFEAKLNSYVFKKLNGKQNVEETWKKLHQTIATQNDQRIAFFPSELHSARIYTHNNKAFLRAAIHVDAILTHEDNLKDKAPIQTPELIRQPRIDDFTLNISKELQYETLENQLLLALEKQTYQTKSKALASIKDVSIFTTEEKQLRVRIQMGQSGFGGLLSQSDTLTFAAVPSIDKHVSQLTFKEIQLAIANEQMQLTANSFKQLMKDINQQLAIDLKPFLKQTEKEVSQLSSSKIQIAGGKLQSNIGELNLKKAYLQPEGIELLFVGKGRVMLRID